MAKVKSTECFRIVFRNILNEGAYQGCKPQAFTQYDTVQKFPHKLNI